MFKDKKEEGTAPPLTRVLREDASPVVRHEAAFVLGQLGFKSAVPALIEAMEQDDFFFSSRRRHTRCSRDWSSDVCSSDLVAVVTPVAPTIWVGRLLWSSRPARSIAE